MYNVAFLSWREFADLRARHTAQRGAWRSEWRSAQMGAPQDAWRRAWRSAPRALWQAPTLNARHSAQHTAQHAAQWVLCGLRTPSHPRPCGREDPPPYAHQKNRVLYNARGCGGGGDEDGARPVRCCMTPRARANTSLYLDPELREQLRALSHRLRLSKSDCLRRALRHAITCDAFPGPGVAERLPPPQATPAPGLPPA